MRLFTGPTNDTQTIWQLYSDLPNGAGANDWFAQANTDLSGSAIFQIKNSYTGFDPIYRAIVRDTANYWEWRVDTSDGDALNWRTAGGIWLYGAFGTGNLGAHGFVAGTATSTIDTLLAGGTNMRFVAYTSNNSTDPLARFIRGTVPDSTGSIDVVVNSGGNALMSRAYSFTTGTVAAAAWYLKTSNTEWLREDSTGHLYTHAHAATINLGAGGMLLEGAVSGNDAMMVFTDNAHVAHQMTGLIDTDCYLALGSYSPTGAAWLRGWGMGAQGAVITGYATTNNTDPNTFGAPLEFYAAKKSGTGVAAFAPADVIFQVSNAGTQAFAVKGDGTAYVSLSTGAGNVGVFDAEQDALACRDLAYGLAGQWKDTWKYGAARLQQLGIMDGSMLHVQNALAMGLSGVSEVFQVLDWVLRNKLGLSYEEIRQQVRATA
jgi:hypothetical protein